MQRIFIHELKVGDYIKAIGTVSPWINLYWIGQVINISPTNFSNLTPEIKVYDTNSREREHRTSVGIISSDELYLLTKDEVMIESL